MRVAGGAIPAGGKVLAGPNGQGILMAVHKSAVLKLIWRINKWNEPMEEPADPLRLDRADYKRRFWPALRDAQPAALMLTIFFSIIPVLWTFSFDDPVESLPHAVRIGLALFWVLLFYAVWSHGIARKVALYPDGIVRPTLPGLRRFLVCESQWSVSWALVYAASIGFALFGLAAQVQEDWLSLGSAFNVNGVIGGVLIYLLHDAVPRAASD